MHCAHQPLGRYIIGYKCIVGSIQTVMKFNINSPFSCNLLMQAGMVISIFLLLSAHTRLMAQTLAGDPIKGLAYGDNAGNATALSADGMRVAVASWKNSTGAASRGHVRIFDWIDSTWVLMGAPILGENGGDWFGQSIALSADGNRLIAGSQLNDDNGGNSGHVRVFELVDSTWQQMGTDLDGEASGDQFGSGVTINADGSVVAAGSWANDGNGYNSGQVKAFAWDGSAWIQRGSTIYGTAAGDQCNRVALSADGNVFAVGAPANDGNGTDAGQVRVFSWDADSSVWLQRGTDIVGEAAGDISGDVSLSADGDRLAVGARWNNGNGTDAGHVRIYDWADSTWVQIGADIDGEAADDRSGRNLALSADGSRIAIGGRFNEGNGWRAGHVRIYDLVDSTWTQLGADIDGVAPADQAGYSVDLAANGSRVVVGLPFNNSDGVIDKGQASVYDLCPIRMDLSNILITADTTLLARFSVGLDSVQIPAPYEVTIRCPELRASRIVDVELGAKLEVLDVDGCHSN